MVKIDIPFKYGFYTAYFKIEGYCQLIFQNITRNNDKEAILMLSMFAFENKNF